MNYIDILIIIFLIIFAIIGIRRGFFSELLTLVGFGLSLLISFIFYSQLGQIIYNKFQVLIGISNLIAFLIIFSLFQALWAFISSLIYKIILPKIKSIRKIERVFGAVVGILDGTIILCLILTLLLIIPFSPQIKSDFSSSKFAYFFLNKFSFVNSKVSEIFAPAADETRAKINNLVNTWLSPSSETKISFPSNLQLSVDEKSEIRMVELVNAERARYGLKPLIRDPKLTEVARKHSEEMFRLSYFDHNSPITGTPFDRLNAFGIKYTTAGENIAYAPNVEVAHNGLMNSPKHRDNILEPDFRKIGIGIISAGPWGEMFTQDFTN